VPKQKCWQLIQPSSLNVKTLLSAGLSTVREKFSNFTVQWKSLTIFGTRCGEGFRVFFFWKEFVEKGMSVNGCYCVQYMRIQHYTPFILFEKCGKQNLLEISVFQL